MSPTGLQAITAKQQEVLAGTYVAPVYDTTSRTFLNRLDEIAINATSHLKDGIDKLGKKSKVPRVSDEELESMAIDALTRPIYNALHKKTLLMFKDIIEANRSVGFYMPNDPSLSPYQLINNVELYTYHSPTTPYSFLQQVYEHNKIEHYSSDKYMRTCRGLKYLTAPRKAMTKLGYRHHHIFYIVNALELYGTKLTPEDNLILVEKIVDRLLDKEAKTQRVKKATRISTIDSISLLLVGEAKSGYIHSRTNIKKAIRKGRNASGKNSKKK